MKKKILALLLGVAALVCCAFGLSACGEVKCSGTYEDMTHFGRKEPTCTQAGWDYYDYCPVCKTYWRTGAHKKGHETTPEKQRIDPLGHDYQNGKCTRCGKTDPALLPDTLQIPDLEISSEGMLTWGGIKVASKYRVEITDEENVKHVYDVSDSEETALDLTKLSDEYELVYGKNYASITAYKPYSENIDGETVADDIPVSESKADFIAVKQNSGYSFTQLTYADEYITINGAYSDLRTDGDKQYILVERQLGATGNTVNYNLSRNVKAAQGVTVSYYRNKECTQAISSTEWSMMPFAAGATDVYIKANGGAGESVYTVRVLVIKPVTVNLIKAEKLASGYNYTTLASGLTALENDYLDLSLLYSYVSDSTKVIVDAGLKPYNRTGNSWEYKYDDCVVPLCQGKTCNFYVIYKSTLEKAQQSIEKYSQAFNCSFVWGDNGAPTYWTVSLRYDYQKTAVYVPSKLGDNDPVVLTANSLGYNNSLEKVVFEYGFTGLTNAVFQGCTQLKEVYIPYSAKDGLGDFLFPAALKDMLTVYCDGDIPNGKWNQISGTFKYFTTVRNTQIPSFNEIMS